MKYDIFFLLFSLSSLKSFCNSFKLLMVQDLISIHKTIIEAPIKTRIGIKIFTKNHANPVNVALLVLYMYLLNLNLLKIKYLLQNVKPYIN